MQKTIRLLGSRSVTIATGDGLWIPCALSQPPRRHPVSPAEQAHAVVKEVFRADCATSVVSDESGTVIAIEGTTPLKLTMEAALPGWRELAERALRASFPGEWTVEIAAERGVYEFRYQPLPSVVV